MYHVGMEVRDLERSIRFYQQWFGFVLERLEVLGNEQIAFLTLGEQRIELVKNPSISFASSSFHLAFEVKRIEQILLQMKEQEVPITEPLTVLENGWKNAFVSGPDGEWIELIDIPS
ncbi:VOC family protein [Lihuaxuella thermophila]|uniref:Lactoylglutathione lyase n=1 Tax=Lihuaxuella thermophila TaxID=1173111 RepID=A0A1H8C0G5_9BACL|nr:VOC family protein [Lihuaxuella thermophila]SEM88615.1 lactoylglutathione lyase [Lihuaxuella thermophila]